MMVLSALCGMKAILAADDTATSLEILLKYVSQTTKFKLPSTNNTYDTFLN